MNFIEEKIAENNYSWINMIDFERESGYNNDRGEKKNADTGTPKLNWKLR